jgi:CRISPR-associated protein Cas1
MGALFAAATSVTALAGAWEELHADDEADGELSAGTRRFAADAEDRIADLAGQLASGIYRPRPLTPVTIAKDDGGLRHLAIPSVADRIVEKALAAVLSPVVDPWLGPSSYAYRPGLGVADAVQQVARLRDEGLTWVAHTDIDDCFPNVDVARVRRLLGHLVDDPDALDLVDALLARPVATPGWVTSRTGPGPGGTAVTDAGEPGTGARR